MACVLCLVPPFPLRAAGRSRLARLLAAGKGMGDDWALECLSAQPACRNARSSGQSSRRG